jgi:raffinose/stachyose/melibiose transport system permease protein
MSETPVQARVVSARAPAARRARGRAGLIPYGFIAPLLLIFAAFYLWPALNTIGSSFFEWSLLGRPWRLENPSTWTWVGLGNYTDTLSDADFWNAAFNTAVWLVVFPTLVTGIALVVSIMIWFATSGPLGVVFRTVFILPMTISLAAVGVIWGFVYNPDPQFGVLNAFIGFLHLDVTINAGPLHLRTGQWLSDVGSLDLGFTDLRLTNVSVIIPAVWGFVGFGVVTITAGLTAVSQDLIDAARVDGARAPQVVRYVLVPALRGPLVIVVVVSVIFALRTFDIVYVLTGGGPAQDTQVLALLLWQKAFVFLETPQGGAAAAIAVLLSAILVFGAYPYLRGMLRSGPR